MWAMLKSLLVSYLLARDAAVIQSEEAIPTSFQAHSFNDLDQWESLYLKGIRNFKVDPYFFQQSWNMLFPNQNHSYIALTHDYPLLNHNKYFSLLDLLREISPSGRTGALLAQDHQAKLTIQLCFKAAPALCGGNKFKTRFERDFLLLLDDFYQLAETLRGEVVGASKLEFILDGGVKPYGCLKDKWPNWKSVWIINDLPYSPVSVLTLPSNESTRFEVLNNPAGVKAWTQMAKIQFGWFAQSSKPVQVWEPNDQQMIQDHIDIYASQRAHTKGICFSSNSDPVMIALYTGAHNAAVNRPVVQQSDGDIPIGVASSLLHVSLLFLSKRGKVMSVTYSKDALPQVFPKPVLVSSHAWERFTPSFENPFVGTLSDGSGRFVMTLTRPLDGSVVLIGHERTAQLPPQLGTVSAAIKCLVVRSLRNGKFAAVWSVSTVGDTMKEGEENRAECGAYAVLFDQKRTIKSVCLIKDKSVVTGADLVRIRGSTFGVVLANQKKQIFSSLWASGDSAVASEDDGEELEQEEQYGEDEDNDGSLVLNNLKQIAVGVAPRFSELPLAQPGRRIIALVLGDSNCANNEPFNKRSGVLLCSASAVAMRGTLTYSLGFARDWEQLFRRSKKLMLSACSSRILHGAFDIGSNAVPELVMTNAHRGEAKFISLHRTVDDLRTGEQTCAASRWKYAVVFNEFQFFFEEPMLLGRRKLRLIRRE
ncbi:hypothetical protein BASA81_001211 [Batrachochytrium salamandrivorans]|nr:hypothetical protein BASA81_001211 [Batrachochytrium salamandrivorans]